MNYTLILNGEFYISLEEYSELSKISVQGTDDIKPKNNEGVLHMLIWNDLPRYEWKKERESKMVYINMASYYIV